MQHVAVRALVELALHREQRAAQPPHRPRDASERERRAGLGEVTRELGGLRLGRSVVGRGHAVHGQLPAEQHRSQQRDEVVLVVDAVLPGDRPPSFFHFRPSVGAPMRTKKEAGTFQPLFF